VEFKPRTEKEIAESRLMPKGVYDFEILEALEKLSKASGKPMIELKLRVSKPDGPGRVLTDYLVAARDGKLRHAAEACGLLDRYNSGSLADADFLRKRGRLKLGIEKDKTHTWPDKNIVIDYIPENGLAEGYGAFTQ